MAAALLSQSDVSSSEEDDRWSVDTVVEVLELDCEHLIRPTASNSISLTDGLLLFCLTCLSLRFVQVSVGCLIHHLQDFGLN